MDFALFPRLSRRIQHKTTIAKQLLSVIVIRRAVAVVMSRSSPDPSSWSIVFVSACRGSGAYRSIIAVAVVSIVIVRVTHLKNKPTKTALR